MRNTRVECKYKILGSRVAWGAAWPEMFIRPIRSRIWKTWGVIWIKCL